MTLRQELDMCRTELRRVYRELHYKTCGDLGYYAPITECPHETCVLARRFLRLPAGSLDGVLTARWAARIVVE